MKLQKFFPLLLIAIMLLAVADLFKPGLPITHDGQDHVARIANFYQGLQEGILLPRWAGNLNWGYGHPILMFLYPLPSYFASLIHFLGFSFVDSVKIVFGLSFIFSGLAMYLWLKEFLTREQAFVGGVLYVFAPYRFVDLYVRGAIGEHVAFIFPPLILYFLLKFIKKPSYWSFLGGAFSLAGLLLAHNAISLMFIPIIIFYLGFLLWKAKNKKYLLITTACLFITGFALAAFFWMPAFFEGKYTLRDIVTGDEYKTRFSDWGAFIYGPWNYGITGQFTVQAGILQWIAVLVAIPLTYLFYKKKNKLWLISAAFLIIFFLTLYIMNWSSLGLWQHVSLIQKFQFPWRFLSVTVFVSAVLGAFAFSLIPKKYLAIGISIFVLCVLFLNSGYWHAKAYQQKTESFYSSVFNGTTDTGESAPIWSVRFMEKRPKAPVEAVDGEIIMKDMKRVSTRHEYIIEAKEKVLVKENTLYFPGWDITVDGVSVPVEFQNRQNHGIMLFPMEKGNHTVVAQFHDTKLRMVANAISISSLFLVIILGILRKKLWRN